MLFCLFFLSFWLFKFTLVHWIIAYFLKKTHPNNLLGAWILGCWGSWRYRGVWVWYVDLGCLRNWIIKESTRRILSSFHGCTCNGGQYQPLIFEPVSYVRLESYCYRPDFLMLFSDLSWKIPKVYSVYPKAHFFPLPVLWGGFRGLRSRGRACKILDNNRLIW